LLQEGVSIRDMRSIAEAITAASDKSQDPVALKAAARVALARQIVQGLVGSGAELPVMTLAPQLEQLLLGSVQQAQKAGADEGAFIEPGLAERVQQSLIEAAQQQELAGKPMILLVAAPLRELMVKFNRFAIPEMRVLAYTEIPDNKQITIEMNISVDND
ncbi:MAG: FHIPEP family type III secretion protein, partial [Cellvibrionaceae bacterium]|nr:FHIPEP family type III secretion protein [Cellvibrionaceae bacterium]